MDFALGQDERLTHLIECKLADTNVHRALAGFADKFPQAEAIQLVKQALREVYAGALTANSEE